MDDKIDLIASDINKNRKQLNKENSQVNRRNYLRSLIVYYEINLSAMRKTVIELILLKSDLSGELNLHKIFPLLDEKANLSGRGKLRLVTNHIPLKILLVYTLKTYADFVNLDEDIFSDNKWDSFIKSIELRHRITHPNFYSDVDISDDELNRIDEGLQWWNSAIKKLRDAHLSTITSMNGFAR
ncbi:hypothetical protein KQH62_02765 [bacterium]|nr:hypothetical protein [bacterium]